MKPLRSSLVAVGVHGLSSVQFMCSDTALKKFFLCPGGQGRKNRETFGATLFYVSFMDDLVQRMNDFFEALRCTMNKPSVDTQHIGGLVGVSAAGGRTAVRSGR